VLPGRQRKFKTIEEFALPRKILESTTATIFCLFSFSSLSSPLAQGETASLSFGSSLGFPRIAVAGAKPAFFAERMREKKIGKKTFLFARSESGERIAFSGHIGSNVKQRFLGRV
jgi:hypothetical protein